MSASPDTAGFLKGMGDAGMSGLAEAGQTTTDMLNTFIGVPSVIGGAYLTALGIYEDVCGG